MNDDDFLDPKLAERFDELQNFIAPDIWERVAPVSDAVVAPLATINRRPASWLIAAAAAVMVLAGIAAVVTRDDGSTIDAAIEEPSTVATDSAGIEVPACNVDSLAESLRQGMPTFDYEPSKSLEALAETSALVVRGQLVEASPMEGGTSISLKLRRQLGGTESQTPVVNLWTPATLPPDGFIGASFVAFLTGEVFQHPTGGQPSWPTLVEGFWIACDDSSPARSVLVDPVEPGWEKIRAEGITLDRLWRAATPIVVEPLGAPTHIDEGSDVYDLRLVDGERFRLSLPTGFGSGFDLIQDPDKAGPILADGVRQIAITYGQCPTPDGMDVNRLGGAIAQGPTKLTFCRPNELLVMEIEIEIQFSQADLDKIDLRPIAPGGRYYGVLRNVYENQRNCSNCSPWGPMVFPDQNVVVNQAGSKWNAASPDGSTYAAVALDTLEEVWSVDTGGFASQMFSGRDALYFSDKAGPFFKVDAATGSELWRHDLPEESIQLSILAPDFVLVRSAFLTEGDNRAPLLRRVDDGTGEILWTATGREATEWQWTRPVLFDDMAIVMDVYDNPANPDGGAGSTLQAFNINSGEKAWATDLQSSPALFNYDMLDIAEFESGKALVAWTVDGHVVRVDPGTGQIIWRATVGAIGFDGTDYAQNGTLALSVRTQGSTKLLHPETGELLIKVDPTQACPVTIPAAPPHIPSAPWPARPSDPESVWFGSDDLWTVLDLNSHRPRKSVWWSANFGGGRVEEEPELRVVYQRLDDPSLDPVVFDSPGTNANTAADGDFMINGIEPNVSGCWRATATYKGANLSYVYEVQ